MASEFDAIRKRHLQMGEEAKQRVMERLAHPTVSEPQKSEFDAVRNRTTDVAPSNPVILPNLNAMIHPTLAPQYQPKEPANTNLQKRLAAIDARTNEPEWSKNIDRALARAIESPVGQAINRFSQAGARVFGIEPELPANTGSNTLNKVLDFAGSAAGYVTNPAQIEQNLVSGSYNVARGLFNTGVGQKVEQGLQNALGKVGARAGLRPQTTDRIATNLLQGGAANALQNAAITAESGRTSARDVGLGALEGAALGGAAEAGLGAIGQAARSAADRLSSAGTDNWYTKLFGNRVIGITPFAKAGKVGTQQQIVSTPIKRDREGVLATANAAIRNTHQTLVDALAPIKRSFGEEAYNIAMDANRANNLANTIIHDKFVDMEGNVIGSSLKDVFKMVPRGTDNEFIDYLVLRDAKDRVARGEKVYEDKLGMNDVQKINDRIAMYEKQHPEFIAAAKEWDQFTKNLRTVYGLNADLLSGEAYAAMEAARPNYVPMRRQFSMSERVKRWFGPSNTGFSGQKAPIKAVSPTGSVRKIVDPRRTIMEATQQWVQNAMNNRVMKYIIQAVQENPEAYKDIAEIVRTPTKSARSYAKAFADQEELMAALENGNADDYIENLSKQFRKLYEKAKSGEDTILTGMINGRPVAIRVKDPEAIRALVSLGPQQVGPIIKALGVLSRGVKRSATGTLAPYFALRNISTDLVQSMIQSKNPVAHLGNFVHALMSSVAEAIPGLDRTPLANLAKDFYRTGGGYSGYLRGEKTLQKSLDALKRHAYLSPEGVVQATKAAVKAPFKALEKTGDIFENVNRMAAYKSELKRLGGERTPENIRKAMNAAREITTNYSRRGTGYKELESIFPYTNAAVQSLRRFLTAFKEHPVQTTIGVLSLAVVPKMLEYATFGNDPDYQKIPARERYRKLILYKRPNGSFFTLQLPPEYLAIGAFTEDLMRKYIGHDPNAMQGVADAILNAYTPSAV
ncbi:MAG: hypothetical protein IRZ03_18090, partial [Acidobacterium ailaaui]|nr:hypothetical protein [Pseudacidobacterium ailaaui]